MGVFMDDQVLNDRVLNIVTEGDQKGFLKSMHYHRYEPTPYSALDELFRHYEVKSSDRVVDFGCGKGRLNFYLHHRFQATVVGIEVNEDFYHEAKENQRNYLKYAKGKDNKIDFHCCLAEEYPIDPRDNRFYFFNPFTIQIFRKVIHHILASYETHEREMELILYYPHEDYIFYLENHTSFELVEEVVLPKLYDKNPNERFLIYRLKY